MQRQVIHLALVALIGGCNGGDGDDDGDPTFDSEDIRLGGDGGLSAETSQVRLCAAGSNVYVAWLDEQGGVPGIWLNRSDDGGDTWLDSPIHAGESPLGATEPELACQGDAVYLVWSDIRDGELERPNVYINVSSDAGATWDGPRRLSPDPEGEWTSKAPAIAAVGDDVLVAWAANPDGAFDIFAIASHDRGGSWGPAVRVDSDGQGAAWSSAPTVVLTATGRAGVGWEDRRRGDVDVFVAYSTDAGDSFGPDARADKGEGDSYAPELAIEGDRLDIVWHDDQNGERYDVFARSSGDGGETWTQPEVISPGDPGAYDDVLPQLAAAGGHSHVVWYAEDGGGYHIRYRTLDDGDEAVIIDRGPGPAQARRPVIQASTSAVVVVWEDDRNAIFDEDNELFYTFSTDGGATWPEEDLRVDSRRNGSGYASDPQIALVDGDLIAAWLDGRGPTADIFFTRLPLGEGAHLPKEGK